MDFGTLGENIPLVSRIFAVCNGFENACAEYRIRNMGADETSIREYAIEKVIEMSGTKLESGIVDVFKQVSRQFSILK